MITPRGGSAGGRVTWRRCIAADGLLREFNDAGVLESSDVLVARRLTELAGADDPQVALAIALVVRALRGGSVCLDLTTVADQVGHPEARCGGRSFHLRIREKFCCFADIGEDARIGLVGQIEIGAYHLLDRPIEGPACRHLGHELLGELFAAEG